MRRFTRTILSLSLLPLISSCAVGPDYKRPSSEIPQAFKEATGWKQAQPKDALLRGNWWEVFGDSTLNELEKQIDISNQNIKVAEAQYRQANALTDETRAAFFPIISVGASAARASSGGGTTINNSITTAAISRGGNINNSYSASLSASWEPDFWGRIRRELEASKANAQASEADLQSARLLAQSELAIDYLQLRLSDAQMRLYDDTLKNYQRSLELTQNQYNVGVAARSDVVQAQAQLQSTQAQAIDIGVQRAQLEHAIAILIGKAPADFALAPVNSVPVLPDIPISMPADLLERRPDIAAAERRTAAANAEIGVAEAAFFPDITLDASGGYRNSTLSKLFSVPNRVWSIGPSIAETVFDAGLRLAETNEAIAIYDQNVATYRQTVLGGLQEVEDNLAALRILEQEANVEGQAVASAQKTVDITTNQYKAGTISFLNVTTVQANLLSAERAQIDIVNRQMIAAVTLIKALGGGWDSSVENAPASANDLKAETKAPHEENISPQPKESPGELTPAMLQPIAPQPPSNMHDDVGNGVIIPLAESQHSF